MIDTSPAALHKHADLLEYDYGTENTVKLLRAIAAEKEAQAKQEPYAWVPAERPGTFHHEWRSVTAYLQEKAGWQPLYLAPLPAAEKEAQTKQEILFWPLPFRGAPQHHKEQPLNMVAPADVPLPAPPGEKL